MTTIDIAPSAARKLKSWKEIAVYFGTDERTVKRWETSRALPIHRVPGGIRAPVYAFSDELEAWLKRDTRKASHAASSRRSPPRAIERPRRTNNLAMGFVAGALCVCLAALVAENI